MRFILGLVVGVVAGVVAGVAVHWYLAQSQPRPPAVTAESQRPVAVEADPSVSRTNAPSPDRGSVQAENLQEELARTGRVIREKAREAGGALADAAQNTQVSARIKAKLLEDRGLSAFKVDVDTADGVVTLSGTVDSHEAIERALQLALSTEGVRKVISTLQVKPK